MVAGSEIVDIERTKEQTFISAIVRETGKRRASTAYETGLGELATMLVRLAGGMVVVVLAVGLLRGRNPVDTVLYVSCFRSLLILVIGGFP